MRPDCDLSGRCHPRTAHLPTKPPGVGFPHVVYGRVSPSNEWLPVTFSRQNVGNTCRRALKTDHFVRALADKTTFKPESTMFTRTEGVPTLEGQCEEITNRWPGSRGIRVERGWRRSAVVFGGDDVGRQWLLRSEMAGIRRSKRCSRTDLVRVCGDVQLAGWRVSGGRCAVRRGEAALGIKKARAPLNWALPVANAGADRKAEAARRDG